MLCHSAILLAALVVNAGAPAPLLPRPWVEGWDGPLGPAGRSRFERKGGKLTITVLGDTGPLDPASVPRLVRDVGGDFTVRVRVKAGGSVGVEDWRGSGLVLTGGKCAVGLFLVPVAPPFSPEGTLICMASPAWVYEFARIPPWREATHLRMTRRGGDLWFAFSKDGKEWLGSGDFGEATGRGRLRLGQVRQPLRAGLPRKLKVGVGAGATGHGEFRAEFDQFELTPLPAPPR